MQLSNKISYTILATLFIIVCLIWIAIFSLKDDGKLYVTFFDVGQGDAIYFRTPFGQDVIVDGGPDSSVLSKLGNVMPFYDHTLELMILTHPDKDHIAGLIDVLERYNVKRILFSGIEVDSSFYNKWKNIIDDKKIPMENVKLGQRVNFGGGLTFTILNPSEDLSREKVFKANNSSVVGRLVYGKNSILFTGDIEEIIENNLIKNDIYLKSDVLKVPHHGSKTSTSQKFLNAISPDFAVISVGAKSRYGHPSKEVLDRLKDINVFRTDKDGDVEVILDLDNMKWK